MTDQTLEQAIMRQIRAFAELPDGWHYGTGTGAAGIAVDTALAVNTLLVDYGARNIEAFPGIDGDVLVAGYRNNDILEIQCHSNGRMDLVHEIRDEPDQDREYGNISMSKFEAHLGDLAWLPKNSFVYYTRPISARRGDASSARHFSRRPAEGEYQYLKLPALGQQAAASAGISLVSTTVWLTIPMYSGEYVMARSRTTAGSPPNRHRPGTPATGIFMDWEGTGERQSCGIWYSQTSRFATEEPIAP